MKVLSGERDLEISESYAAAWKAATDLAVTICPRARRHRRAVLHLR